jgi:hypothetical protein
MTNPFQVSPGGVVQGIGPGPIMGQGIADVLAQMQIGKENQFRQQELQNQMMQQQALAEYYRAQAEAEQQRIAAEAQENLYKREGLAQRGRAVQNYMQGQPGVVQPGQSTTPQDSGNIFRDLTAGGSAAIGGQQGYDQLFNGVSPENVPDALGDLKDAKAVMAPPAAPELPTSAKEMQFLQHLQQADPSGASAKFFYDNWVKKQPGVVVNNLTGQQETEHGKKTSENIANRSAELYKDANNAAASMPSMMEAYKLVPRTPAGFGANQAVFMHRVLGRLGIQVSKEAAADSQTMIKLLRDQTLKLLETRALGSGTAVSEKDREFMERQSAADLSLEPDAIRRIIRINMGAALERMISTRLELQQEQRDFPATKGIQGRIDMINRKLEPVLSEYWKMRAEEDKREAQLKMDILPQARSMFK